MKLAIVTPTYQRPDGRTPELIKDTLSSVASQKHKDFKLFIIGDDYTNDEEFKQILQPFQSDFEIYSHNLDVAVERTKYKDKPKHIWRNGGVTAFNFGVEQALKEGYNYICHLDHDDIWTPQHLLLINNVITATSADFICTVSYANYRKHYTLPNLPPDADKEDFVPFLPKAEGIIHSSTCYNYKTIPLRLRDSGNYPADADLWKRMNKYIDKRKLKSYCIPKITCSRTKANIPKVK